MSASEERHTSANGLVGDLVAVDVVTWDGPVNGGRSIGDIRDTNTLRFAQTLQETTHNKETSRAKTKVSGAARTQIGQVLLMPVQDELSPVHRWLQEDFRRCSKKWEAYEILNG